MKKLLACVLLVCLLLGTTPAYAAGKLSETQQNFWIEDSYWTYAHAYARIDNIGDKPIKVHAGILEVYDENGENITSSDYLYTYAEYLQPNEYTYVSISAEIEDHDPPFVVDDYMLTVTGKSDSSAYSLRLPCEVEYATDVSSGWGTYDYVYATITNNTDAPLFNIEVVFALLDDDGNILYLTADSLDYNQALLPGSAVLIEMSVDEDIKAAYTAAGLEATHVDAIAYANIENDD